MLDTHNIFKFRVWEMPFPAFSAGHFRQINTQENAEVSCLFYPSQVLSTRHSQLREKRPLAPLLFVLSCSY